MISSNFLIFAALSVSLAVLSFITLFLATRHDKVVSLAGPLEEDRAVKARIQEQRATLIDLEEEIEKRRAAFANLGDMRAEVDALLAQRDQLLAEWNQSQARRDEVAALRLEIESAQITKLAVDAELAESRANLAEVAGRLEKAEDLVRNIDALKSEESRLQIRIDELREARQNLEEAENRVADLAKEAERHQKNLAHLQGSLDARTRDLAETDERLAASKASHMEIRRDLDHFAAELAAGRQRLADIATEQAELSGAVTRLEASKAALEQELNAITQQIERERSAVDSVLSAKTEELEQVSELLSDTIKEQASARADLDQLKLSLMVERQKLSAAAEEQAEAQEKLTALTARHAAIEREIERARNIAAGGTGEVVEDPLRELKDKPQVIERLLAWPLSQLRSEEEALHSVKKRFEDCELEYSDRTLRAFHTAMKVNDTTQMTVLAGISGTGKSQLPRQYAAGMGIGFLQVPVQPRWDSPQDLMGFYNYIEGRFRPTDMARAMYALDEQNNPEAIKDRMLMILLDEMNLARVEYYFSDFLSRLESRPARGNEAVQTSRKDAEIELEIPRAHLRIFPGYNLLFAGTMNEDESTQSLSDKVVDRANVMRFGAPKKIAQPTSTAREKEPEALSRAKWEQWCAREMQPDQMRLAESKANEMLALMQDFGKPFGHRLGRAIPAYVSAYPKFELLNPVHLALADQIEMRLLPKLRGVDVEEKGQQFIKLQDLAKEFDDPKLADAISDSVEAASASTGQFVWKGVVR